MQIVRGHHVPGLSDEQTIKVIHAERLAFSYLLLNLQLTEYSLSFKDYTFGRKRFSSCLQRWKSILNTTTHRRFLQSLTSCLSKTLPSGGKREMNDREHKRSYLLLSNQRLMGLFLSQSCFLRAPVLKTKDLGSKPVSTVLPLDRSWANYVFHFLIYKIGKIVSYKGFLKGFHQLTQKKVEK